MLPQTIWFVYLVVCNHSEVASSIVYQNSTSTADAIVLKGRILFSISVIRDQDVDESVVVDIKKSI